jgi:hypothetical protein
MILTNAVLAGSLGVAKVVVAAGTDLEARSEGESMNGATALMTCLTDEHESIANFLIKSGADSTVVA